GAKKLPDAARGVGRSLRILKSEVAAMDHDETATAPPAADRAVAAAEPAAPAPVAPVPAAPVPVAAVPVASVPVASVPVAPAVTARTG
ncbi:twin-arginine translocase TatA/TatE family subunit, partial [Nakamurella sp.]|uniref:twin-arginine translocase TatA/TatE family subunit n=1 Tax=Nakamurella sp. TaxID=1869182 RepID=UPI003B3B98E2